MNKTNVLKLSPKQKKVRVCPKCHLPLPEGGLVCLTCNPPTDLKQTAVHKKTSMHVDMPSSHLNLPYTAAQPQDPPPTKDETETENPPKSPNKAGKLLIILLLVAGLGGFASWAYLGELPWLGKFPFDLTRLPLFTSKKLVHYVPEDSDIFISINTAEDSEALTNLRLHWQTFPQYLEWEAALKQLIGFNDEGPTTWEQDFKPWLGNHIGFFIDFQVESSADIGLLFQSKDIEQTKQFMEKLSKEQDAKTTTSEYQSVLITQIETKTDTIEILPDANSLNQATFQNSTHTSSGFYAFLGKTLVVSSSRSGMYNIIDTYEGGPSFADKPSFTNLETTEVKNEVVNFYLDPSTPEAQDQRLISILLDLVNTYNGINLNDGAQTPIAYSLLTLTISVEPEGLNLICQAINTSETASTYPAFTPALPRSIPKEAILYWSGSDLTAYLSKYIDSPIAPTTDEEETHNSIRERLGSLSIDTAQQNSFLDSLKGEYAFVILPGQRLPILSLLINPTDLKTTKKQIDIIAQALPYALFSSSPAPEELPTDSLTQQEFRGITIRTIQHPDIPDTYEPAYAFIGDTLIICSHPDCFELYAQVYNNEKLFLTRNSDLNDYIENLAQGYAALYYFNKSNLDTFLQTNYELMAAPPLSTLDFATLSSDLSPLKSILGSIQTDQNSTTANIKVMLSD